MSSDETKAKEKAPPVVKSHVQKDFIQRLEASGQLRSDISTQGIFNADKGQFGEPGSAVRRFLQFEFKNIQQKSPKAYLAYLDKWKVTPGFAFRAELREYLAEEARAKKKKGNKTVEDTASATQATSELTPSESVDKDSDDESINDDKKSVDDDETPDSNSSSTNESPEEDHITSEPFNKQEATNSTIKDKRTPKKIAFEVE
ncbi:unnamed protein product, partial [Cylindrotheca closterium]